MTGTEMENLFDVLFNNITSNQAPGLDTYEKSVFLTKGQDEVLKNYFNPKGNKYQEGFDGSQKRQIDFSSVTRSKNIVDFDDPLFDNRPETKSVDLPSDLWFIINERATVTRGENDVPLVVRPISFDEYDRLMSKPFKRPLHYQAWRLINNDSGNKADIIVGPSDVLTGYAIRYVKRPKPIITGDIDTLTIDGYTYGTGENQSEGCELDPMIHEEIVQRAVELAKMAWTSTGQDNTEIMVQAGQRSE